MYCFKFSNRYLQYSFLKQDKVKHNFIEVGNFPASTSCEYWTFEIARTLTYIYCKIKIFYLCFQ